ncbi:MAG: hypothetical protein ACJAWC_001354 [Yoonia sp.]|jgi:hypothetical protein
MTNLPTLDALKSQAKSLRQSLASTGHAISHARSLELLAKQLGHRDWNTLHAKSGNTPAPRVQLGQHITGLYLGRPFAGTVIRVSDMGHGVRYQLTVRFDDPVNVSKFASNLWLRPSTPDYAPIPYLIESNHFSLTTTTLLFYLLLHDLPPQPSTMLPQMGAALAFSEYKYA